MPTAFVASWGSGKPVIGFMADIDGLPETSQKPGVAYHAPLISGGPGHGEGHNAGQALNVTAALVLKQIMTKYKIPGTIRVYPGIAEELLASRTYMVEAGLFRDLDVMLSSHIANDFNTTYGPSGSGLVSTEYSFHGQSAHSAGSPWAGPRRRWPGRSRASPASTTRTRSRSRPSWSCTPSRSHPSSRSRSCSTRWSPSGGSTTPPAARRTVSSIRA
jgi:metal-dependent amidase/aminoacylase/carboxypeptidase family protein